MFILVWNVKSNISKEKKTYSKYKHIIKKKLKKEKKKQLTLDVSADISVSASSGAKRFDPLAISSVGVKIVFISTAAAILKGSGIPVFLSLGYFFKTFFLIFEFSIIFLFSITEIFSGR